MQKYNSRADVPAKYKWDLTSFFKNQDEFDNSILNAKKIIDKLPSYKGCTNDSNRLLEFLTLDTEAGILCDNLYTYSYLINDQELGNQNSIQNKSKAENLYNDLCVNCTFFDTELLKLDKDKYNNLFNNKSLFKFKSYLDNIYRYHDYILTDNEEKIVLELTNAMDNYSDISSNLLNMEHDYGKVKLDDGVIENITSTNYRRLLKNNNSKIRKKVYNSYNRIIDRYSLTNASLLNNYVKEYNTIAKIRGFRSSWEKHLFDVKLDDLVFKNLVKTTESNLDVLKRYFKIKKDYLKLDKFHMYDLSLEINSSNKEYSIEECIDIIRNSLKPLGEDYISKFNKIIDNHYIDFCQYKGKCSGGYSFATATQDSRILLSYNSNLSSVSTIAHEAGHNVHHQYVKESNDVIYRSASSLICEVASLTNECLLSDYLYKNGSSKEEKLAGLNNILEVIVSNLFGAVREGKMEQQMYNHVLKGNIITKEFMDKLTRSSIKKYYGDNLILDKYSKNSWVSRSHFYMNYYLYSYSICICVALYVASKILSGDKDILDKYIEFLCAGSDKDIYSIYSILGIDLNDSNVYEDAIKYFEKLVDEFELICSEMEC